MWPTCIGEKHLYQNVSKYNSILCYIQIQIAILSSNLIQIEGIPNSVFRIMSYLVNHGHDQSVVYDTIIHQLTAFHLRYSCRFKTRHFTFSLSTLQATKKERSPVMAINLWKTILNIHRWRPSIRFMGLLLSHFLLLLQQMWNLLQPSSGSWVRERKHNPVYTDHHNRM